MATVSEAHLKVSLSGIRRAGACGGFQRITRRLRERPQRGFASEPGRLQSSQGINLAYMLGWLRGQALPNPSFKRSPNGVALGPRGSAVYHLPRGPSATPLVPA